MYHYNASFRSLLTLRCGQLPRLWMVEGSVIATWPPSVPLQNRHSRSASSLTGAMCGRVVRFNVWRASANALGDSSCFWTRSKKVCSDPLLEEAAHKKFAQLFERHFGLAPNLSASADVVHPRECSSCADSFSSGRLRTSNIGYHYRASKCSPGSQASTFLRGANLIAAATNLA